MSADRQAAARILGVQNGFSDCLKPCFLKILVLVLGEAFISIANIARARVAHVTAPAEMMCVLSFHFGPSFGKRDPKERELVGTVTCWPLESGRPRDFRRTPRGSQRTTDAGVSSVAVAPGRKVLEACGTQGSCSAPGAMSPLFSRAAHTWTQLRSSRHSAPAALGSLPLAKPPQDA